MIDPALSVVLYYPFSASNIAAAEMPRAECLRPEFVCAGRIRLNRSWESPFDNSDAGLRKRWQGGSRESIQRSVTPYQLLSRTSGIGEISFHDVL